MTREQAKRKRKRQAAALAERKDIRAAIADPTIPTRYNYRRQRWERAPIDEAELIPYFDETLQTWV